MLKYSDAKTAETIAKAVSPDNVQTPSGLSITTINNDCRVVTDIIYEGKIATFIATIDDLLFSVSTAEKTLQTIQQSK